MTLILIGTFIALLILEAVLRVADISYPYFYIPDAVTGYAHKPLAEGWWRKEGWAYVRINSTGFRDREHLKEKPPGTFRVAILGDSYSEALQVPIEQAFWTILEQELRHCRSSGDRQVEVINFGVSGYGTAQELLLLRHRGWEYSPDLVLLAFVTGNDIRNNSRVLQNDSTRPYFVHKDGQLILDASFRNSLAFRGRSMKFSYEAFHYLRVLQVAREAEYKIQAYLAERKHHTIVGASGRSPVRIELDQMEYIEPQEPLWKEAWQVTEDLIARMRDEVAEKGADFLLVTLSNPDQVHPDPRHRQGLAKRPGIRDLLYPDSRLESWAERRGISVLSLAQPMAAYAEEHHIFLHGFQNAKIGEGHWNPEGHRLAGKLIAQKVCDSIRR